MKKILLNAALALTVMISSANSAEAQAVEQGNVVIAAQYGFPNFFGFVIKSAYKQGNYTGVSISNLGPVGLQFEYMVSDKIGLGIKTNYTNTTLKYQEDREIYDSNGMLTGTKTYDYTVSFPRFRLLPRFAIHFGSSDSFDGYFGIAAGYSTFSIKAKTNDPDWADEDIAFSSPTPFGFRLDVGGNYFFTDNLGLNFEIGIGGGPLVNLGIAAKF